MSNLTKVAPKQGIPSKYVKIKKIKNTDAQPLGQHTLKRDRVITFAMSHLNILLLF